MFNYKYTFNSFNVKDITLNPDNPSSRGMFDKSKKEKDELFRNIRDNGIIYPPLVIKYKNEEGKEENMLIAGHRRFVRYNAMGIEKILCLVIEAEDEINKIRLFDALDISKKISPQDYTEMLMNDNISEEDKKFLKYYDKYVILRDWKLLKYYPKDKQKKWKSIKSLFENMNLIHRRCTDTILAKYKKEDKENREKLLDKIKYIILEFLLNVNKNISLYAVKNLLTHRDDINIDEFMYAIFNKKELNNDFKKDIPKDCKTSNIKFVEDLYSKITNPKPRKEKK